jgi:Spy/CpxP family protein refolding chaperone
MEKVGPGRQMAFADLNLTEAQKTQLKTLQESFRQKMKELHANENMTVKDQRDQRFALARAHKQQVEQVLTPEQKATLESKRREQQQKMQERGEQHWQNMAAELQLTEAQKQALTTARTTHRKNMQQIKQNENMSRSQKQAALQAEQQKYKQVMESTLTEAQRNQWKELQQHRPNKRGAMQGRPGQHGRRGGAAM